MATPSKPKNDTDKGARLDFSDNKLLQELCGRHDANLIQIEERLGVQVVSRGNQIAIFGPQPQVEKARVVLQDLYELLQSGMPVSAPQVDAALRMTDSLVEATGGSRPADMMGGQGVIHTPLKKVAARSQRQHTYINALRTSSLVFGVGPAGTGKTYLATAMALSLLHAKEVKRIILTRPVVEAGENLGFLPGTLEEKVDPYLRPFFDAMNELVGPERTQEMMEKKIIEIAPLAYMRGRTLSHAYVMLDEAQNTTVAQMKMFLTRMGEGSRLVVSGDPTQVDLKRGVVSGLKDALRVLEGIKGIEVVHFSEVDVVRHEMVSRIVQAYDQRDRQLTIKLDEDQ